MASRPKKQTEWIVITERFGYLVVPMSRKRSLIVLLGFPESGKPYLKVAGYGTGRTTYVGERFERLAFEVKLISQAELDKISALVKQTLPAELRNLELVL